MGIEKFLLGGIVLKKSIQLALLSLALILVCTVAVTASGKGEVDQGAPVPLKLAMVNATVEYPAALKENRIWNYVQDTLNIKISTLAYPNYNTEQLKLLISGGEVPDTISYVGPETFRREMYEGDQILDIGSMVKANPKKYPVLNKIFNDPFHKLYQQRNYGVGKTFDLMVTGVGTRNARTGLYFNMRIMNELGLELPKSGDEFVTILKTIATEKPDIIPFDFLSYKGATWGALETEIFKPVFKTQSFGNQLSFDDRTKVVDYTLQPETKEAWKLIRELAQMGVFNPEMVTWEQNDYITRGFATGKTAIVATTNCQYYTYILGEFKKHHPDATVADVQQRGPYPGEQDPERSPVYYDQWHTFITRDCKNPDKALELLEWAASKEGQTILQWGFEGIHYTKDASKPFGVTFNFDEMAKDYKAFYADGILPEGFKSVSPGGFLSTMFIPHSYGVPLNFEDNDYFTALWKGNERHISYNWTEQDEAAQYMDNKITELDDALRPTLSPPYAVMASVTDSEITQTLYKAWDVWVAFGAKVLFSDDDFETLWTQYEKDWEASGFHRYVEAKQKGIDEAVKLYVDVYGSADVLPGDPSIWE
jgi:ABC-type glycerol-3-phosphate transport system substrate-binding protein